jgi:hypothetical protein
MATDRITASASWQEFIDGPADVNIQNTSRGQPVEYAVGSTTPSGAGALLKPLATHPVKVDSGEKLYVRAFRSGTAYVVATDA